MGPTTSDARLLTIAAAIAGYPAVTVPMVRAWIRGGKLAAARAGKSYLIDPADLSALLRPTLRTPPPRARRESETARATRQLANAGIG